MRMGSVLLVVGFVTYFAGALRAQDGGEFARAAAGFEQAGGASAAPIQKAFIDLFVSSPFPAHYKSVDPVLGPPLRIWGDVRSGSDPQQINADVKSFPATALVDLGQININQLVRSAEFLAGLQFRVSSNLPGYAVFGGSGRSRTTMSLIASIGMATPFRSENAASIFEKPPESSSTWAQFAQQYPAAAADQYQAIAFVAQDRSRFFRQYYGGLRFESHYLDAAGQNELRPPASVDIAAGQNEAVTAGALHGLVLRVDAYYPLPFEKGNFVYLYATGVFDAFTRQTAQRSLLLEPSVGRTVYDPDVFVAPMPPSNRDFYRIGVGIDFVQMIKNLFSAN
jgi:hypothetical protein